MEEGVIALWLGLWALAAIVWGLVWVAAQFQ